ncbi:hypothetical protein Clacol_002949 [Clathrus columnatus]|uniref:ferric-chelate reductase (NADPH) n=1 Tax=Clathrus columnatus TaxID=1419009 RepID=A0AAV5A3A0_9AGAM|nr:hypothetical protein Clacol_002949 [Clathrus columnatus]
MAIGDNSSNNASSGPLVENVVALELAFSYSFRLWLCICAFIGVLFISHIVTLLVYYSCKQGIVKESNGLTKFGRTFHSIVNVFRIVLYRVTISTGYYRWNVAEGCVILGYLLILLVWEFVNCYNPTTGTTLDVQYWSIRAGVMAINQLALLQILTAKNNVVSLLTGITYEKLQIFHRVLGRISLGFALTVAFIPSFVFWALDRTMRFARTVLNYIRSRCYSRNTNGEIDTIRLVSGSVVLITLHRKMDWKAGQNVFLTIPAVSRSPFEAHPFTIATIPDPPINKDLKEGADYNEKELWFIIRAKDGFTRRLVQWATQSQATAPRLPITFVDGPYGNPPDVDAFKNVILIAGGTGVSFTLPLFQNIVKNAGQIKKSLCRSVAFHWIVPHYDDLNWIASPLLETFKVVVESLQIDVHFYVTRHHASETSTADQGILELHLSPIRSEPLIHEFITVNLKKPEVQTLLHQTINAVDGSTIVVVSGPASLANDVRQSLGFSLYRKPSAFNGANEIYLHVESDYE